MTGTLDKSRRGCAVAAWTNEIRALLTLAGPLVATQLAQIAMMTTDVVMLGRLGKEALAGSALGLTIFYFAWQIGMGPAVAVSPMIAQILGKNPRDTAAVRAVVRMGFWAVLLVCLPLCLVLFWTEPLLLFFAQQPGLAQAAGRFVLPLCLGLPLSLGYQVLRNFATALSRPKAPLWVMAAAIPMNALFDYALIFGHFGFPRLGLIGSGIASTCSFGFSFLAMTAVVLIAPEFRRFRVFRRLHRPHMGTFTELVRLGIPIGLTMVFETMLFNAATLLMGTFGTAAVAAHQIAMNVSTLTFMVPLGVGMAATVRVGLAAGAGDRKGVRRAGYAALGLSAAFMSLCALAIVLLHGTIARLYFSAGSAANADAVALASTLLLVVAAYQVFDGLQVTTALVLRGLKDTRMPMWIAAVSYWLFGFPTSFGLSVWAGMRGLGVWLGLAFALFLAATSLSGRFYLLSRDRQER